MLTTMIADIRRQITSHREAYYAGAPTIGTEEYDRLCRLERWLTDLFVLFEVDKGRP